MSIIDRYKIEPEEEQLSRYRNLDRLRYNTGETLIETQDRIEIPSSSKDIYHKVTVEEENRLDLISYHYYNTPLLWWVIAAASSLQNPLEVGVGTVLRVPEYSSLYGYKGVIR